MSQLLAKIPAWVLLTILAADLALRGALNTQAWTPPVWVAVIAGAIGSLAAFAGLLRPTDKGGGS